jgi:hypothetical protein
MFIFESQELVHKLKDTSEVKELVDDLQDNGVNFGYIIERLKNAFGFARRGKACCLYKLEVK